MNTMSPAEHYQRTHKTVNTSAVDVIMSHVDSYKKGACGTENERYYIIGQVSLLLMLNLITAEQYRRCMEILNN